MHHYLPLDPSVHEEGSKVDGSLDLTIGSHFGSTSSKFKTLLNPNYTYVPLTYYVLLLGLCDFENFHISQLPQYTSSVSRDYDGKQGWRIWTLPTVSHFGSTLSKWNALSNLVYTRVPLSFPFILLTLFIFHISPLSQYTSSVSRDYDGKQGWWTLMGPMVSDFGMRWSN